MIPNIKRILYATDLTKNSAYAFRYAVASAQKHDAQIHILHVIEKFPSQIEGRLEMYFDALKLEKSWQEKRDEQIKRIHDRLKDFAKRELQDNSETLKRVASISVVEGDPAAEILQRADELDCDLVIVGTHSRGLIGQAFLGSVAEKVLHRITRPVFIIPVPTTHLGRRCLRDHQE